jgi:hypothetical protein
MATPVIPSSQLLTLAGDLQADLALSNMHLYTAVVNPVGPRSVLADFTEAAFTGYAPAVLTAWGAPFLDPSGDGVTASPVGVFPGPSAGSGATILGAYVTDTANAVLNAAVVFDTPIPLSGPHDSLSVMIQLAVGGGGSVCLSGSFEP